MLARNTPCRDSLTRGSKWWHNQTFGTISTEQQGLRVYEKFHRPDLADSYLGATEPNSLESSDPSSSEPQELLFLSIDTYEKLLYLLFV